MGASSVRAGTFGPGPEKGRATKRRGARVGALVLTLLLAACGRSPDGPEPAGTAATVATLAGDGLAGDAWAGDGLAGGEESGLEPAPPPLVSPFCAPAVAADPRCFLGVVTSAEAVDVTARADGVLSAVSPVGTEVPRGALLARVDASALREQRALAEAQHVTVEVERRQAGLSLERADQARARREALAELLPRDDVEAARFDHQAATMRLEEADARLAEARARIEALDHELARAAVRAPFDGRVAARYRDAGTVVARGTPILRLLAHDTSLVRFAVAPAQAAHITPGQTVRVEAVSPRIDLRATVDAVTPEIDPAARMVFVEARLLADPATPAVLAGAVARVSHDLDGPSCLAG